MSQKLFVGMQDIRHSPHLTELQVQSHYLKRVTSLSSGSVCSSVKQGNPHPFLRDNIPKGVKAAGAANAEWKVTYEKSTFTFYTLLHLIVNKLNLNCVNELGNFPPNAVNSYEMTRKLIGNHPVFIRTGAVEVQDVVLFCRLSEDDIV